MIPKLRLGLAVTIDNHGRVECWDECQARQLVDYITAFDQIVSYNGLNFDNYVLSAYTSPEGIQAVSEKTFDLFQHLATSKGIKRRLAQWSEEYFGISNHSKYLLSLGYGFEEGRLVEGFERRNLIPFILRVGASAQKVLVWAACFEDTLNTLRIHEELSHEQRFQPNPFTSPPSS